MEFAIYSGDLIRGTLRTPTNIEVSSKGFGVGIGRRTQHPWSTIRSIDIHGPSSATSRVTATRVATLGVFALAAKKSTTETVVIVTLTSGTNITVAFRKKTEPEVRSIIAPFLGEINKSTQLPKTAAISKQTTNSNISKSKADQILEIGELFKQDLIDKAEFEELKAEIFAKPNKTDIHETTENTGQIENKTDELINLRSPEKLFMKSQNEQEFPEPIGIGIQKFNKQMKQEILQTLLQYSCTNESAINLERSFKFVPHHEFFYITTAHDHELVMNELTKFGCQVKAYKLNEEDLEWMISCGYWKGTIHQAPKESTSISSQNVQTNQPIEVSPSKPKSRTNTYDQIEIALAKFKDGLLSEDEFLELKNKLLTDN